MGCLGEVKYIYTTGPLFGVRAEQKKIFLIKSQSSLFFFSSSAYPCLRNSSACFETSYSSIAVSGAGIPAQDRPLCLSPSQPHPPHRTRRTSATPTTKACVRKSTYCSLDGGGCGWTTTPAAENRYSTIDYRWERTVIDAQCELSANLFILGCERRSNERFGTASGFQVIWLIGMYEDVAEGDLPTAKSWGTSVERIERIS